MEELDLLKTHWKKADHFPKINKDEIRRMLHKNSSSILRWILFICLAEFIVGLSLKGYYLIYETEKMKNYDIVLEVLGTLATAYFLIVFYKEYNKIKTYTDTKSLMKSILKARSWVKIYIAITIGIIIVQWTFGILDESVFHSFKEGFTDGAGAEHTAAVSNAAMVTIMLTTFTIIGILLLLYYRFVYVRLIQKLKKNYDELVSLES